MAQLNLTWYLFKSLRHELKRDNISSSVACPAGMNTNAQVSQLNRTGNWFTRISGQPWKTLHLMVIKIC
ncbi:MAG: hypothetical protein IPP43_00810 [Chitinophagaceae bacterium]|nr:hypothetical protein [Chitinophagaceae bacterium]